MSRPYRVLMIGDYITDVYQYGNTIGLANEDPVLKFRPFKQKTSPGGVGFCADLMQSFCPPETEISTVRLSESTICRFIDDATKRNLFTIHTERKTIGSPHILISKIVREPKADLIYLHLDDLDLCYAVHALLQRDKIPSLGETCIAADIPQEMFALPVHYIADYPKDYTNTSHPKKPRICGITTSSKETSIILPEDRFGWEHETIINPHIEYPVDTCGAGDALFSCFLAQLIRYRRLGKKLAKSVAKRLVTRAQAAAYILCTRQGTYVPTWQEVVDMDKELFNG